MFFEKHGCSFRGWAGHGSLSSLTKPLKSDLMDKNKFILFKRKGFLMSWKTRATVQNLIARLPLQMSHRTYYFIQRHFGELRQIDPKAHFIAAVEMLGYIKSTGAPYQNKTFFEMGTGRRVNMPLALWLGGASKIVTVDLNPYLKPELVFEDLDYVRSHQDEIKALFGEHCEDSVFQERFRFLIDFKGDFKQLLDATGIEYMAPADASRLQIPDRSIDFHVSRSVLGHIPADDIVNIFIEGKRVLRRDGYFVHKIDLGDHFMYSDKSISVINFLQFTEQEWKHYAGNRFMYQNRLRVDDYLQLFQKAGIDVLRNDVNVDERSLMLLQSGFPVDKKFADKSNETIATRRMWVVGVASKK